MDGQKIEATVSVGVATTTGYGYDMTDFLASAYGAPDYAKNAGRNRVVLASTASAILSANNVVLLG